MPLTRTLEISLKQADVSHSCYLLYRCSSGKGQDSAFLWLLPFSVPAGDEWFMVWEFDQGVIPEPFVGESEPLMLLIFAERCSGQLDLQQFFVDSVFYLEFTVLKLFITMTCPWIEALTLLLVDICLIDVLSIGSSRPAQLVLFGGLRYRTVEQCNFYVTNKVGASTFRHTNRSPQETTRNCQPSLISSNCHKLASGRSPQIVTVTDQYHLLQWLKRSFEISVASKSQN